MQLPQNLVSHHLKKLRDENIVISKKEWLNVKYSINHKDVDKYLESFNTLFN
jgi:DNA-binding transcriptional ArsR family regulator